MTYYDVMVAMTTSPTVVNDSDYNVTMESKVISSYDKFVTVLQTSVVAIVSSCIILSNIINLSVLVSARGAMPWATRLFLINLSFSDLLAGVVACAPAVVPAMTGRWIYGDVWCQISGVTHGSSVTVSIWSIAVVGLQRYVATALPLRYRKLAAKPSKLYMVVAGLWTCALITFIAPILTKPDWTYYRFSVNQKICGLHWEYPSFCVITGLYIPILSGGVLVFSGVRIRATLRHRQGIQARLHQLRAPTTNVELSTASGPCTKSTVSQSKMSMSRRTMKIVTWTSIAYFTLWSPYVALVLIESFARSFRPPPAVDFAFMWLANTNSAVNVFIYSSTNVQFRRQCVLLVSQFFCSRLFCFWRSGTELVPRGVPRFRQTSAFVQRFTGNFAKVIVTSVPDCSALVPANTGRYRLCWTTALAVQSSRPRKCYSEKRSISKLLRSRLFCPRCSEQPEDPVNVAGRNGFNLSTAEDSLVLIPGNLSADAVVTSPRDPGNSTGRVTEDRQHFCVPRNNFLVVNDMIQTVSIDTLTASDNEDDLQQKAFIAHS